MSRRDFFFLVQQPWDLGIGSNARNLALELAKSHRVLYVNIPLDRITLLRNKPEDRGFIERRKAVLNRQRPPLERISEGLWTFDPPVVIESINWMPEAFFGGFNRRNNVRLAREYRTVLRELGFQNWILFNDSEMFRAQYMIELLEPGVSVYYSRDNLISTDYFSKHGPRWEPRIMAQSDVCVANSLYLTALCAQHNPNSHYIGQGCELELFQPHPDRTRPSDVPSGERPIIGYVGVLFSMRLDEPLLLNLSRSRPDWDFVLVGPEDEVFRRSALHQQPNVFFTGAKKPVELPNYMQFFDVAVNPQVLNAMTIGNYPRKIDEYLSMGLPVVATRTAAMEAFAEYCSLAEGLDSWIESLEASLSPSLREKAAQRMAFARSHSWENSALSLMKAIETTERTRTRR
ncbi:glycosyltransferase [bacterium]|nr:glycosyltransferase [bacterium]